MKKILILLLLLIAPQTLPHKRELKLYQKVNKVAVIAAAAGEVLSLGGLGFSGLIVAVALKKKELAGAGITFATIFGVPSLAGFIGCSVALNALYEKSKQHKPILIFDEEGFTYSKPRGLFKDRKYVRYLWKDIVSHWATGISDYRGNILRAFWCYHIKGENKIVKIDTSELDIPKELQAKVESLRMGNIRALWD